MNIEVNGINTHYITFGEKNREEKILILHGWGCNCEVYRGVAEHLSENFNVIIPDLPGFGKTREPAEKPEKAWGVSEYSDFIKAFCEKSGIENFTLFGHSLGGRIAVKLLTDGGFSQKIKRAVITGGAGVIPKRSFKSKVRGRMYKIGRFFLEINIVKGLFPNALESLKKKHGSPDYIAASPVMRQCLVKIVNEDLTPLFSAVHAPVLLIWGENDDQTPISDGRLMETMMPNAGLAVIKNAGHYAFLDRPALFYDITDAFLIKNK